MSVDFTSPSNAPMFIQVTRARSQSPAAHRKRSEFCRVTNKSESMEDHLYVPPLVRVRHALAGCKITSAHNFMGNYRYVYPVIDVDGRTKKMNRRDMMCRVTAKNQAIGDYKFVFPAALAKCLSKDVRVDTPGKDSILIPKNVLSLIPGGVNNVLVSDNVDEIFLLSSDGDYYPTSSRMAATTSLAGTARRNTLPGGGGDRSTPVRDCSKEAATTTTPPRLSIDLFDDFDPTEGAKRASSVPIVDSEGHLLGRSHRGKKRLNLKLRKTEFQMSVIAATPVDLESHPDFTRSIEVKPQAAQRRKKFTRTDALEVCIHTRQLFSLSRATRLPWMRLVCRIKI